MKEFVAATLKPEDRVLVVASVWNRRDLLAIPCKVTRVEETRARTRVFVFPEDSEHAPKWVNASDVFVKLREEPVKVIY